MKDPVLFITICYYFLSINYWAKIPNLRDHRTISWGHKMDYLSLCSANFFRFWNVINIASFIKLLTPLLNRVSKYVIVHYPRIIWSMYRGTIFSPYFKEIYIKSIYQNVPWFLRNRLTPKLFKLVTNTKSLNWNFIISTIKT